MDTFRADVKATLRCKNDSKKTAASPPSSSSTKLYRVQVGAYAVKANADAMLKKVKAAGFTDAFIKTE